MIQSKEDLKRYLEMDRQALNISKKHPSFFGDDIWKYEIVLRKHEYYLNCGKGVLSAVLRKIYGLAHYKLGVKLGFEIPCNVIAGGLRINHYGLIVINPQARIGEWCDIHQGTNIGENIEPGSVPTLGNNVWIGPGAKIFGKIKIGDNTMIGANAVVTASFPNGNCRIAGIPAKIISTEKNAYEREMKNE